MLENILVCVSHPNHAERIIQRGKLLADALGGECLVLSVDKNLEDDMDFNQLQTKLLFQSLAEKYKIKLLSRFTGGKKISTVIAETTKEQKITQIVIGQAIQSKLEQVMKQSIINELFQQLEGVDVHVVEVNRDISDPSNQWDRGFEAQLVLKGTEYHLNNGEKEEEGIDGVFYKESSTDFANGFFVIPKEKQYQVVRVKNGVVESMDVNIFQG